MATRRSLALVAALTWALTASAHSERLTFADGFNEGWAELRGPQFLFAWSDQDIATVRRALDKLEEERLKDPAGIDDYVMGQRARILKKLESPGFFMYGMYWDIELVDGEGRPWRLQPMSGKEVTLTGFAVSRDRYCRPEDQDIDDLRFLAAGVECYVRNTAAIALFKRIETSRHVAPGGGQ
jgi:hypothetical protein